MEKFSPLSPEAAASEKDLREEIKMLIARLEAVTTCMDSRNYFELLPAAGQEHEFSTAGLTVDRKIRDFIEQPYIEDNWFKVNG